MRIKSPVYKLLNQTLTQSSLMLNITIVLFQDYMKKVRGMKSRCYVPHFVQTLQNIALR
jgi:hypothetical protein